MVVVVVVVVVGPQSTVVCSLAAHDRHPTWLRPVAMNTKEIEVIPNTMVRV